MTVNSLSTVQGRYFLLERPVASPGQCGICGYGGDERLYLDPRLDYEFYGSLIFCETCVADMASAFGFITPARAQELQARVKEVEQEVENLTYVKNHLEDLNGVLGALRNLGPGTNGSWAGVMASNDPARDSEDAEEPGNGEGSDYSPAAKSADEQRSNDLRNTSSTNDTLFSEFDL